MSDKTQQTEWKPEQNQKQEAQSQEWQPTQEPQQWINPQMR